MEKTGNRKKHGSLRDEQAIFRLLRIAAAGAGVIGTLIAVWLGCFGVSCLSWGIDDRAAEVKGKLIDAGWEILEENTSEGWYSYLCS